MDAVDYRSLCDATLNEVHSHVKDEACQRLYLPKDRALWVGKEEAVAAEIKRRRVH